MIKYARILDTKSTFVPIFWFTGNGFTFHVPSRAKGNQAYVPELDRIVLKDNISKRAFASLSTGKKAVVTARILSLVHELCRKNIHVRSSLFATPIQCLHAAPVQAPQPRHVKVRWLQVTKRDMFYTDVNLFQDQGMSDTVLEDVSCMLGCTRSSLHVVASEKGVVVGRLTFMEAGDAIDCQRMGVGGKAIPPHIDKVNHFHLPFAQSVSASTSELDGKLAQRGIETGFMDEIESAFWPRSRCTCSYVMPASLPLGHV